MLINKIISVSIIIIDERRRPQMEYIYEFMVYSLIFDMDMEMDMDTLNYNLCETQSYRQFLFIPCPFRCIYFLPFLRCCIM